MLIPSCLKDDVEIYPEFGRDLDKLLEQAPAGLSLSLGLRCLDCRGIMAKQCGAVRGFSTFLDYCLTVLVLHQAGQLCRCPL